MECPVEKLIDKITEHIVTRFITKTAEVMGRLALTAELPTEVQLGRFEAMRDHPASGN